MVPSEKSTDSLMGLPLKVASFLFFPSHLALRFSLSLIFDGLIIQWLGEDLFKLILFGDL